MADEADSGGDFTVADLVVKISGDNDGLVQTVDQSIDKIADFDRAIQKSAKSENDLQSALNSLPDTVKRSSEAMAEHHGGVLKRLADVAAKASGVEGSEQAIKSAEKLHHVIEAIGPVWGGVALAAAAAAFIIGNLYQQQKELNKAQIENVEYLHASAEGWKKIAEAQIQTTAAGTAFRDQAAQASEEAEKRRKTMMDRVRERGMLSRASTAIEGVFIGQENTSFGHQNNMESQEIAALNRIAAIRKDKAKEQDVVQRERNASDRASAIEAAQIQAMYEGPLRERAKLENDLESRRRASRQNTTDRATQADDANKVFQERKLGELNAINPLAKDYERQYEKIMDEIRNATTEAIRERKNAEKDGADDIAAINQEGASELLAIQRQEELKQLTDARSLRDAKIAVDLEGYARERALAAAHAADQQADYTRAGRDATTVAETAGAEKAAAVLKHEQQVRDAYDDLINKAALATYSVPKMEVAWQEFARHLTRDLSASEEQMALFKQTFMDMSQAEADKPLNDQMEELNVQLDLATHKISDLEAVYKRLHNANLEASDGVVQATAAAQEKVRLTTWAQEQLKSMDARLKFADFTRQLKEAVRAGVVTADEAGKIYAKGAYDSGITKPMNVGSFNSSYRGSEVDVSHLNMDPSNSVAVHIGKSNELLVEIRDRLGNIVSQEKLQ